MYCGHLQSYENVERFSEIMLDVIRKFAAMALPFAIRIERKKLVNLHAPMAKKHENGDDVVEINVFNDDYIEGIPVWVCTISDSEPFIIEFGELVNLINMGHITKV
jgi:hypothetical protein